MAIIFHCEHCGKKIEAQDSAGGKWAKCPSCKNKLYIPEADTGGDDEFTLAPIDEDAKKKERKLMAETHRLTQDILKEKGDGPGKMSKTSSFEISEKDLMKNIILYLRQMANGELDDAKITLSSIKPYSGQAVKLVDRIALSDIPEPELADIPGQVISGLIRTLREEIS